MKAGITIIKMPSKHRVYFSNNLIGGKEIKHWRYNCMLYNLLYPNKEFNCVKNMEEDLTLLDSFILRQILFKLKQMSRQLNKKLRQTKDIEEFLIVLEQFNGIRNLKWFIWRLIKFTPHKYMDIWILTQNSKDGLLNKRRAFLK